MFGRVGKVGIQKRTLLIVGCGDITVRRAPLLKAHYQVMGLYRKPESRANLRLRASRSVYGDWTSRITRKFCLA